MTIYHPELTQEFKDTHDRLDKIASDFIKKIKDMALNTELREFAINNIHQANMYAHQVNPVNELAYNEYLESLIDNVLRMARNSPKPRIGESCC